MVYNANFLSGQLVDITTVLVMQSGRLVDLPRIIKVSVTLSVAKAIIP